MTGGPHAAADSLDHPRTNYSIVVRLGAVSQKALTMLSNLDGSGNMGTLYCRQEAVVAPTCLKRSNLLLWSLDEKIDTS